jgi:hypothetical protein
MIGQIRVIGQILLRALPAHSPHRKRLRVRFQPLPLAPLPQIVLVVEQQLVQAGARHIHQP